MTPWRILCAVTMLTLATGTGCGGARVEPIDITLAGTVTDADELYSSILRAHVHEGVVDYEALGKDERLNRYIAWLATTTPESLADERSRLAYWINAYNAYTLKVVVDNFPINSIHNLHSGGKIIGFATKRTVWDKKFAEVGGTVYSLNHIEHQIIRKDFDDPRIHFALVCAARSCPHLRPEAYAGAHLDEQLDDQGQQFFAQSDKNRFDPTKPVAYLSKILKWYGKDFGKTDVEVLRAIAPYLEVGVRKRILSSPADWKIEYTSYDWDLNGRSR